MSNKTVIQGGWRLCRGQLQRNGKLIFIYQWWCIAYCSPSFESILEAQDWKDKYYPNEPQYKAIS